ncbi:MAG: adenylyltransferase/cytidyltransferase family protein [Verrucomicrobia bacterium]|nr:adenylyltransferase/cytidyltransferase family protein [Verrucomicrobiota bacterium]
MRYFTLLSNTSENWALAYRKKLVLPADLSQWAEHQRSLGKKIATLNGSFDLLHAGHLHMIYTAKNQADLLLLALNTDASIQAYKSPLRPIVPLEERLQMVAALSFVDAVTFFEEVNPIKFLEKVQPDVHVNGAEYGHNCIEAETVKRMGGKLYIVELIDGRSTSRLIEKVKQCG